MLVDSVRCSSVLTAGVFETLGTLSRYPLMIALVTRFLFGEGRCALRTPTPVTPSWGGDRKATVLKRLEGPQPMTVGRSRVHPIGTAPGRRIVTFTTPRRTDNGSR